VRVLLGFGVYSAGLAAFVAEIGMRPAFWEGGTYAGLEGVPFFCGGGVHLDALLDAHDLRLAALITAACGLMLALSACPPLDGSRLPLGASLLGAGTLPLLVIHSPDQMCVPPAYLLLQRGVQVLLAVAAIGAALVAGRVDRRWTAVGIGVGAVFAVLTMTGVHGTLVHLTPFGVWIIPVLAGVPAATALLLVWSRRQSHLGTIQYGAAAVVLVGLPVLYGFAVILGMVLSSMSWSPPPSAHHEEVLPTIGAGPVAALVLLYVHLCARPEPASMEIPGERRDDAS